MKKKFNKKKFDKARKAVFGIKEMKKQMTKHGIMMKNHTSSI